MKLTEDGVQSEEPPEDFAHWTGKLICEQPTAQHLFSQYSVNHQGWKHIF